MALDGVWFAVEIRKEKNASAKYIHSTLELRVVMMLKNHTVHWNQFLLFDFHYSGQLEVPVQNWEILSLRSKQT